MTKFNFITVCTNDYPMHYAEVITKRFQSLTEIDFNYYCFTDRPKDITGWATPLELFKPSNGWWNKMNLYSSSMPEGTNLYMDIDIVIRKNFDEEIQWAHENIKDIGCISDAIGWKGERFSSSFMIMKSGKLDHIFQEFVEQYDEAILTEGGDQIWTGPRLGDVLFIDEQFPNLKKNLKFDLGKVDGNKIHLPMKIEESIKLVDCGGRPKPHELSQLSYIKENWHDVLASSENPLLDADLKTKYGDKPENLGQFGSAGKYAGATHSLESLLKDRGTEENPTAKSSKLKSGLLKFNNNSSGNEPSKKQNSTSEEHIIASIDLFKPYEGKIAMVVAHPDDETLWGGGLLSRLFPIDVICCSIPRRDPERILNYFEAIRSFGHFPIVLPFQESEPNQNLKHLEQLDLSNYDLIISHGKDGEYGHLHHKQIHQWLLKNFKGEMICFGFGDGNIKLELNEHEKTQKIQALKCYNKVSPFDNGKPKWRALLDRYDIDETTEYYQGNLTLSKKNDPKNELNKLGLSEIEIRKRADYQHFSIEDGKLKDVEGRMNTKMKAVEKFLPTDWNAKNVLDIGCDFGFWSFLAATNGAKVIGLDRSRDVRAIGRVNIPLLNNLGAERNNLDAKFRHFEAGTNWNILGKFDFVFCMSLYHHIFNVCENHDAIWYWLWQNTEGTLLWENPTEMQDVVVQINLKKHLYSEYTESKIRNAALKYFDIEQEQPALHETTRTVWYCKPKKLKPKKYKGKAVHGAGGASKAFAFSDERRCKEFHIATGIYPFSGSLNIELSENFDWSSGYFVARFLDVEKRGIGLDQNWVQRTARLYPFEINGMSAWAFRFESDNYPPNFIELISEKYLRGEIEDENNIELIKL